MTKALSTTRASKVANQIGVSGQETQDLDAVDEISQEIAAGVVELTAMGALQAMQMKGLSLHADQDVEVEVLGPWYNILACVAQNVAVEAHFTFTGDLTAIIMPGDILKVDGTVANDGYWLVGNEPQHPVRDGVSVQFPLPVAGVTSIFLTCGHDLAPAGAVGRFCKVMSVEHDPVCYAPATVAVGPPGVVTFVGDLTEQFAVGDYIIFDWGTDTAPGGKDGIYQIQLIAYAAPDTTITLDEASLPVGDPATLMDNTVDGDFHRVQIRYPVQANETMVWTNLGIGKNPFQPKGAVYDALQGDCDQMLVDNTANAVAANFVSNVGKDPVLP